MAKPTKKGKGPRSSSRGPDLDKNALENLTSTIDKKLGKRKQPPTKAAGDQYQKRQRNTDDTAGNKKSGKIDEKTLLEEIKALGGDESDLALIQGIDSDDEEDAKGSKDSKAVDKGLKDELAAFSKQLGFAEVEMSEASDQDDDEDEEEDENEDEEDDFEDVDEEEDDEDEIEAPKETAQKKGNMVGSICLRVTFLTTNSNIGLRAQSRLAFRRIAQIACPDY
jgi:ribosome biogenesis protein MAK21